MGIKKAINFFDKLVKLESVIKRYFFKTVFNIIISKIIIKYLTGYNMKNHFIIKYLKVT